MNLGKFCLSWAVGALLAAGAVMPAAASADISPCTTLSGGGVVVNECTQGSYTTYDVTNNTTSDIGMFAVSTSVSPTPIYSELPGWGGKYIDKMSWDQAFGDGSFVGFFGSTDTAAFLMSFSPRDDMKMEMGSPILAGTTTGPAFFFEGAPNSNFVAWSVGSNPFNTPLAGSLTSVSSVPEPEAYAMALCGLGVLALVRRRRQQAA